MIWAYWGNQSMSFLRYMTLHSLCKLNDEVTLICGDSGRGNKAWIEKQDMAHYCGPDHTNKLKGLKNLSVVNLSAIAPQIAKLKASEVHTSDLLGWFLMNRYGGTVTDMDIVFTKPVPEVSGTVQMVKFDDGYTPVSFMQGAPDGFWTYLFELSMRQWQDDDYESCGSKLFSHVKAFPETTKWLDPRTVFPFYRNPWGVRHAMVFCERHALPKQSIGIHWYGGVNHYYNSVTMPESPQESTIWDAIRVTYEG